MIFTSTFKTMVTPQCSVSSTCLALDRLGSWVSSSTSCPAASCLWVLLGVFSRLTFQLESSMPRFPPWTPVTLLWPSADRALLSGRCFPWRFTTWLYTLTNLSYAWWLHLRLSLWLQPLSFYAETATFSWWISSSSATRGLFRSGRNLFRQDVKLLWWLRLFHLTWSSHGLGVVAD